MTSVCRVISRVYYPIPVAAMVPVGILAVWSSVVQWSLSPTLTCRVTLSPYRIGLKLIEGFATRRLGWFTKNEVNHRFR